MSAIFTGEWSEERGEYELLCEECTKPVGWLKRPQLAALSAYSAMVLCANCDARVFEAVPLEEEPKGDRCCTIWYPGHGIYLVWTYVQGALRCDSYADGKSCDGLSSSPYLRRCAKMRGTNGGVA